jgi:hypothetical protein
MVRDLSRGVVQSLCKLTVKARMHLLASTLACGRHNTIDVVCSEADTSTVTYIESKNGSSSLGNR